MNGKPEQNPGFLQSAADHLTALLVSEGFSRERSQAISARFADWVRREWGGFKLYIRSGRGANTKRRNAEIARRWNGKNTLDLCREYEISESCLRQICKASRSIEGARPAEDKGGSAVPAPRILTHLLPRR